MTENRPEELAELEARAHHALEHAEQLEPREVVSDFRPILRLWHYPAFFDHRSWTVFKPARRNINEAPLVIREVNWVRKHDLPYFLDPLERIKQGFRVLPTIEVRDARMPASDLSPLLAALAEAPVPVAGIEARWGLDGERFGFENCESGFLSARLEWWGDGPDDWSAFSQMVARLRDALQQCFSETEL
ncbi:MAG TPA: hypothetical protein VH540_06360 [Ktedonobacterales bacterium]|jgi:hypothetical protein